MRFFAPPSEYLICAEWVVFYWVPLSFLSHVKGKWIGQGKELIEIKMQKKPFHSFSSKSDEQKNRFELEMDAFGAVANFSVLFCQDFSTMQHSPIYTVL